MPETNDPPKRRGRPPKVKPKEDYSLSVTGPPGWIGAEAEPQAMLRPLPLVGPTEPGEWTGGPVPPVSDWMRRQHSSFCQDGETWASRPTIAMAQLVNTVRLIQNEQQSIHASPTCKLTLCDYGIVAEQTNGQDKRTIVVPFSNVRFYQLA